MRTCLGLKKWIVVPKMEGANTIDKLRDLELGNEIRKVLARMLFVFAVWTVRSMHQRGVHFLSFLELRDKVLVGLQCPWLVRCCPTRSHKQRRQDRVCPPLPTPGVTIYRSDGACRLQVGCSCMVGRCSCFGC